MGSSYDHGGLNATGFGTVDISVVGPATIDAYSNASNTFAANPGGSEIFNISGTAQLSFDGPVILSGSSTTINVTDTAGVYIQSTNASVIDAASSGGLSLGGDANFNGVIGDQITGSATHPNQLGGSLGNDVITASNVGGDQIVTGGGGDTINLNVHSVSDTVELAGVNPNGSITSNNDLAQPGFWGVPPSGPGASLEPQDSTSADQTLINNFTPGSGAGADILQFSVGAWGSALAYGNGSPVLYPYGIPPGYVTEIDPVSANATLSATANVIELTGATFANASALANALGGYNLTFGGGNLGSTDAHMLFLYNDPSGNAHIADVDFVGGNAATRTGTVPLIVASDMVELVGVSATSLTVHNIHFA
jgi:hypothetical protein